MTIFEGAPRLQRADMDISEVPSGMGGMLGAAASEAARAMPTVELWGMGELGAAKSTDVVEADAFGGMQVVGRKAVETVPMPVAKARVKDAGLDRILHLGSEDEITAPALDIMMRRARERAEHEATIARGPSGFIPGTLSVGTSFLVGAIDPLNIATAFIPVMGELRYAKLMASAGESALARAAVRAGVGATAGVVGTLPLLPIEAAARSQEGQDYTMAEALHSIIFNAGLGGLLHSGGGAIADVLRRRRGVPLYPFAPERVGRDGQIIPAEPFAPRDPVRVVFDDVRRQLLDAGVSDDHAAQNAAVVAMRYRSRAAMLGEGETAETLYRQEGIEIRRGDGPADVSGATFDQGPARDRMNLLDTVRYRLFRLFGGQDQNPDAVLPLFRKYNIPTTDAAHPAAANVNLPFGKARWEGERDAGVQATSGYDAAVQAAAERAGRLSVREIKKLEGEYDAIIAKAMQEGRDELTAEEVARAQFITERIRVGSPAPETNWHLADETGHTLANIHAEWHWDEAKGYGHYTYQARLWKPSGPDTITPVRGAEFGTLRAAQQWAEAHLAVPRQLGDLYPRDLPRGITDGWSEDTKRFIEMFKNEQGEEPDLSTILVHEAQPEIRAREVQQAREHFSVVEGANTRSFDQSDMRAPMFFSGVARAVGAAKQVKASADQWLGMLKNAAGVKAEELEWLGLVDWLRERKGPVTKQQVADYVRANQIEVTEVMRGGAPGPRPRLDQLNAGERERLAHYEAHAPQTDAEFREYGALVTKAGPRAVPEEVKWGPPNYDGQGAPLPGGENYRELLLTLPDRPFGATALRQRQVIFDQYRERLGALNEAMLRPGISAQERNAALAEYNRLTDMRNAEADRVGPEQQPYSGSHWEQTNVLAHVRFDERAGPAGERILHIAEIQSDWHQTGRSKGYRDTKAIAAADAEFEAAGHQLRTMLRGKTNEQLADQLSEQFLGRAERAGDRFFGRDGVADEAGYARWLSEFDAGAEREGVDRYVRAVDQRMRADPHGTVPDAPFKTTWGELALKRMIRYAAENRFDRITWDTGATNADRYDLSKQISRIAATHLDRNGQAHGINVPDHAGHYFIEAFDKQGDRVIGDAYPADALPDVIGKELADRIIAETEQGGAGKTYSGLDLKVGGEGMRGFYDHILPTAAGKLTKKFGGKVERSALDVMDENVDVPFVVRDRDGNIVHGGINSETYAHERAREIGGSYDFDPAATRQVPVHALDITPALREAALSQGFPLFQRGDAGEPRGRITLAQGRAIITLFGRADASTFMHESAHLWLDELVRDAAREGVPQALRDDLGTVLRWLGVDKAEDIGVAQHEQWARGFEQYLAEGRAPSSALARAFEAFKGWLTAIYRSLADLGTPITDDIRRVMDRMLATPDEIAARPLATIADLPPQAREDVMRVAAAALVQGEPVRAGEVLDAAAKTDARIAEAVEAGQPRMTAEQPPVEHPARVPFGADFPSIVLQQSPNSTVRLREHPDFEAAKAGSRPAAATVVVDTVSDRGMERLAKLIGDRRPTLVAVHAEEATGRNALPMAYAEYVGKALGLEVDTEIVQANRPERTGSRAIHRLRNPVEFDGPVEAGRDYLLVDDAVTQGGTLAALRSYIEARGGRVLGATTLIGSPFSHILAPARSTLARLRRKLPDLEPWWKATYGHGFEALTNSELQYLATFDTTQSVRDNLVASGQAGRARGVGPGDRSGDGGEGGAGPSPAGEAGGVGPAVPPTASAEPAPVVGKPRAAWGPRARDPETYSLFEFLADQGGLRPDPELTAIFDKKNPVIFGFGRLIRKNGMSLDRAREAAVGMKYLLDAPELEAQLSGGPQMRPSETTTRDLLDALDAEARGQKQYRMGREKVAKVDRDERLHHINNDLDAALTEVGLDPAGLTGKLRDRVIQIMDREGVTDPLVAHERAVMEESHRVVDQGAAERIEDDIPGWDVPDDAGPAPPPGGVAAGLDVAGGAGARGPARDAGPGDRAATGAAAERAWRDLARRQPEHDQPDIVEASRAAEALPEPPSLAREPSARVAAAEKAAADAEAEYKANEAYLPDDLKARVEQDLRDLQVEAADRAHVLAQGAACLAAATGAVAS